MTWYTNCKDDISVTGILKYKAHVEINLHMDAIYLEENFGGPGTSDPDRVQTGYTFFQSLNF